jgi:hypothetical protein
MRQKFVIHQLFNSLYVLGVEIRYRSVAFMQIKFVSLFMVLLKCSQKSGNKSKKHSVDYHDKTHEKVAFSFKKTSFMGLAKSFGNYKKITRKWLSHLKKQASWVLRAIFSWTLSSASLIFDDFGRSLIPSAQMRTFTPSCC